MMARNVLPPGSATQMMMISLIGHTPSPLYLSLAHHMEIIAHCQ